MRGCPGSVTLPYWPWLSSTRGMWDYDSPPAQPRNQRRRRNDQDQTFGPTGRPAGQMWKPRKHLADRGDPKTAGYCDSCGWVTGQTVGRLTLCATSFHRQELHHLLPRHVGITNLGAAFRSLPVGRPSRNVAEDIFVGEVAPCPGERRYQAPQISQLIQRELAPQSLAHEGASTPAAHPGGTVQLSLHLRVDPDRHFRSLHVTQSSSPSIATVHPRGP